MPHRSDCAVFAGKVLPYAIGHRLIQVLFQCARSGIRRSNTLLIDNAELRRPHDQQWRQKAYAWEHDLRGHTAGLGWYGCRRGVLYRLAINSSRLLDYLSLFSVRNHQ